MVKPAFLHVQVKQIKFSSQNHQFVNEGNQITSYLSLYHTKSILKILSKLNYLVYNQGAFGK